MKCSSLSLVSPLRVCHIHSLYDNSINSLYNYLLNLVSLVKCFADLVILSNALVVAAYVVAFDGENITTVVIE